MKQFIWKVEVEVQAVRLWRTALRETHGTQLVVWLIRRNEKKEDVKWKLIKIEALS